ncbi:unnamed protein product [Boreogadus saida]
MLTIGELRALLHHPVTGDTAEIFSKPSRTLQASAEGEGGYGCMSTVPFASLSQELGGNQIGCHAGHWRYRGDIQQTISTPRQEYVEGVFLLQGEISRQRKLLTAWRTWGIQHFVEGKPTRDNPLPVSPFDRQTTLRRTPKHQPPRKSATSETIRNKSGVKANQPIMEHEVQTHHMNQTMSHVLMEANMLLEKMQGLGLRPVLFLASSWHDQNPWVSKVFAPPCNLSETAVECLQRMKALFDLVIKGV